MADNTTVLELKDRLDAWVAKYIRQTVSFRAGTTLTAAQLNELFNLIIEQGDDSVDLLYTLKSYLEEVQGYILEVCEEATSQVSSTATSLQSGVNTSITTMHNAVNTAIANAKSYVDGVAEDTKDYLDNSVSSSKAYVDAEVLAMQEAIANAISHITSEEVTRQTNEATRQANETARQNSVSAAVENINSAISNINAAATRADNAAKACENIAANKVGIDDNVISTSYAYSNQKVNQLLNDLDVGIVNLLTNTESMVEYNEAKNNYIMQNQNVPTLNATDSTENARHIITDINVANKNTGFALIIRDIQFKAGEIYTFSCDIKGIYSDGVESGGKVYYTNNLGYGWETTAETSWLGLINNVTYTRVWFTFTVPSDFDEAVNNIRVNIYGKGMDIYIKRFCLTKGRFNISWSPAPEDLIVPIANNLSTTVEGFALDALQGKILAEQVATKVDKTSIANKTLTQGFDLNDALGNYETTNSSIIASLLNKPQGITKGEITVSWYPAVNNNYGIQELRHTDGVGSTWFKNIYIRYRRGTWGAWSKLLTSDDIVNNQSTTVTGFAVDAIQINQNIEGSYAAGVRKKLGNHFYTAGDTKIKITIPNYNSGSVYGIHIKGGGRNGGTILCQLGIHNGQITCTSLGSVTATATVNNTDHAVIVTFSNNYNVGSVEVVSNGDFIVPTITITT